MLFQLLDALHSSRQRQLRATAAMLCTLVLCAGCAAPTSTLNPFAAMQTSNTEATQPPTADDVGDATDDEPIHPNGFSQWEVNFRLGRTFANTSINSPLWLAPANTSNYIDFSYKAGIDSVVFTGDDVRFLGPTNDTRSFIVNVDSSLNYYNSDTYEYEGSLGAEACSAVTHQGYAYCADPFSNALLVIDAENRLIQSTIPFSFHAWDIELIGSKHQLDLLLVRGDGGQTFLTSIDNQENIKTANRLDASAHCGMTNQDQVVLCSEPDGKEIRLNAFHIWPAAWGCDMKTEGRVLTGTHGWIVASDKKLQYYLSDCTAVTEAPITDHLSIDAYPWQTPLQTGDSSPDPKLELESILEQPLQLYDSGHRAKLTQVGNSRSFTTIGGKDSSITLAPDQRIVSIDMRGHLLLTAGEYDLKVTNAETGQILLNAPHANHHFVTIRNHWFASLAPNGMGQMLTVFVPIERARG